MRKLRFLPAAFLFCLALAASVAADAPADGACIRSAKGGWLSRNGDYYVLHLKGSWYEMGKAHGELLRDEIRQNTTGVWAETVTTYLGSVTATVLRNMVLNLRPVLPDELNEELRGLADGSGVPLEDLQAAALMGGPWQYMGGRQTEAGQGNPIRPNECSSFAAFGAATKGGKLFYTHNFDWVKELGIHDRAVCVAYDPDEGQRFCTLGWAGIVYVVTGLNESKISAACIGATSAAEKPYGLPMGLIIRKILQNAHNLDEAEAIVRGSKRLCGFNYVMADGKVPEARVLETNAEMVAAFRPNQRSKDDPEWMLHVQDALFRADTAMNPAVRDRQTCSRGRPKVPGLESPRGCGSYDSRYKVIGDLLKKHHGQVDMEKAIEIMQTSAMPNANMQSFVCNSTDMVFRVAVAKGQESAHRRRYIRFDFSDLFKPAPKQTVGMR